MVKPSSITRARIAPRNKNRAFGKVKNGHACKPIPKLKKALYQQYIVECSSDELATANISRDRTLQILESCKGLFDHVTVKVAVGKLGLAERKQWEQFYSTPGSKIMCKDVRYAVLSPDRIDEELEIMKKIQFKKDVNPENDEVYAYVYPTDKTYTVYLCNQFWKAPDKLTQDSKLGTLIHEVSHFLGTDDITYSMKTETDIFMLTNKDHQSQMGEESTFDLECKFGKLSELNANNLEYEFELDLCHTKPFRNKRYDCCGAKDEYSVCYPRMHTFEPMLSNPRRQSTRHAMTLKSIDLNSPDD